MPLQLGAIPQQLHCQPVADLLLPSVSFDCTALDPSHVMSVALVLCL